eukprot:429387_1
MWSSLVVMILLVKSLLNVTGVTYTTSMKRLDVFPAWKKSANCKMFWMAYWNSTLYTICDLTIHYTPFVLNITQWDTVQISDKYPLNWTTKTWNRTTDLPNFPAIPWRPAGSTGEWSAKTFFNPDCQQQTQIDNLLYGAIGEYSVLMITDLATLTIVPMETYNPFPRCGPRLVTYTNNGTHLFTAGGQRRGIHIYDIVNDIWSASQIDPTDVPPYATWKTEPIYNKQWQFKYYQVMVSAMAVTHDGKYMYLFGGLNAQITFTNKIYKYNIQTDTISLLDAQTPTANGYYTAVTASQSKIFLIGYGIGSSHGALIFDYKTETFKCSISQALVSRRGFFHKEANILITLYFEGNIKDISYLPMDLNITFNEDIFDYADYIIHPGKSNNISCLTDMGDAIIISPLIIS